MRSAASLRSSVVRTKMTFLVHYVLDGRVVVGEEQVLDRDDALELAVRVSDVADVDGLLVLAHAAYARDALAHVHVLLEVDELGRHYAAGGVVRVFEVLVMSARVSGVAVRMTRLTMLAGSSSIMSTASSTYISSTISPSSLSVMEPIISCCSGASRLREDLRALALAQEAEDHRHTVRVLLAQLREERGDVELVHVLQLVLEGLQLAAVEQLQQALAALLVITLFQSRSPPSFGARAPRCIRFRW